MVIQIIEIGFTKGVSNHHPQHEVWVVDKVTASAQLFPLREVHSVSRGTYPYHRCEFLSEVYCLMPSEDYRPPPPICFLPFHCFLTFI